jgi:peroxiredoxin
MSATGARQHRGLGSLVLLSLAWAAMACSGSTRPDAKANATSAPIELGLRMADGKHLELADLRGQPLLLFIFTTFDDASQLALAPLERVLKGRGKPQALGVAVQPDPHQLLPLYREALAVSFPLGFDPENSVVSGGSMLGPIATVPTYILLDAAGRIAARHTGAMSELELESFLAAVR